MNNSRADVNRIQSEMLQDPEVQRAMEEAGEWANEINETIATQHETKAAELRERLDAVISASVQKFLNLRLEHYVEHPLEPTHLQTEVVAICTLFDGDYTIRAANKWYWYVTQPDENRLIVKDGDLQHLLLTLYNDGIGARSVAGEE